MRLLNRRGVLGSNVLIAGTYCLYAYEAMAAVSLDSPLMATMDIDLFWDTRPRLRLLGNDKVRAAGLMRILKKADRTFKPIRKRSFRAVNENGFMVDLIKAAPRRLLDREPFRWGDDNDLEAAEVRNLQWLASAPKISQVVIGADGFPVPLAAPDPRAFALHKFWLSEQEDREPVKKRRDREQANAVAGIIIRYMPNYPLQPSKLRMFLRSVVESASKKISESILPAGFGGDEA